MRLLLDTHTFLWFVLSNPRLSPHAASLVVDPSNDVFISPATDWEIAIKVGLGKLNLGAPYDDVMRRGITINDFEILAILPAHTSRLTAMPLLRRDPFDRLLVAQARCEAIPIVSADAIFDAYGVTRLW